MYSTPVSRNASDRILRECPGWSIERPLSPMIPMEWRSTVEPPLERPKEWNGPIAGLVVRVSQNTKVGRFESQTCSQLLYSSRIAMAFFRVRPADSCGSCGLTIDDAMHYEHPTSHKTHGNILSLNSLLLYTLRIHKAISVDKRCQEVPQKQHDLRPLTRGSLMRCDRHADATDASRDRSPIPDSMSMQLFCRF